MLKYITLNNLVNTVRKNLSKIPHDIDLVVGVMRSGMLAATIISEYLNIGLTDVDSFIQQKDISAGNRLSFNKKQKTNKILVIDDTCYSGKAMNEVRRKLSIVKDKEIIYSCVFLEATQGKKFVDLYLEDISKDIDFTKGEICLYEWNIFHHYSFIAQRAEFDLDGVLCVDPPSDENQQQYEDYIKDAIPLFVPTVQIGKIVSYRLNKYRDITLQWLEKQGIKVNELILFNANDRMERNTSGISPEMMKATVYKNHTNDILFFESDDYQARRIHELTGKAVYCVGTNKMYNG